MTISVSQAIEARRSVRSFAAGPVSREELQSLFEAARLAPSSLNSQPWRFKAVTDPETLSFLGTSEATRSQSWLAKAPAVIVCCADLSGYVRDSQAAAFFYKENKIITGETMDGIETYVARAERDPELAKFGACAMNTGLAVSFMMLRAVEMGLGTCWVGMFDEQAIKKRLELAPGLRVVCLLAVGRPSEEAAVPRKRKSLEEIVLA